MPTPSTTAAPRVALVLSGCGRADGSEITEAVSVLVHLSRRRATYRCFALNEPQASVINHVTDQAMPDVRNQLVEAARIARGTIDDLATLREADFDALIVPGGFGAAKNLCDFAAKGAHSTVHPAVQQVILAFRNARKPMGFICIAPVIAARVLGANTGTEGTHRCELTVGSPSVAANAINDMGAKHVPSSVLSAHVDQAMRVVSTPAYMCAEASAFDVFTGVGVLVERVLDLCAQKPH